MPFESATVPAAVFSAGSGKFFATAGSILAGRLSGKGVSQKTCRIGQ